MKKLPNIILIIMDSAAAKHSSLYRYHRKTTPCLERIAEEGVLHRRCFSPAFWTLPSHASLFTGLYPSEHGCDGGNKKFTANHYSIVEILKSLGYKTIGITSNPLVSQHTGFNRGFDEFHEMWLLLNSNKLLHARNLIKESKEKVKGELNRFINLLKISKAQRNYLIPFKLLINQAYSKLRGVEYIIHKSSTHATLRALRLSKRIINKTQQTPIFLFINFMQTHNDFNPPRKFDRFMKIHPELKKEIMKKDEYDHYAFSMHDDKTLEALNALYDGEMLFLDSVIFDLYSFLKERNILDNIILIITSDHGELIGEHGHVGHQFSLYNELLHVPLIIKYPGDFGLKKEVDEIVQTHDIFSTISEVVESPFPIPESSVSLLSSHREFALSQSLDVRFKIEACKKRNPSFKKKDFMQPQISVITKDMLKLIRGADGSIELYDLNKDLYETKNLINLIDYAGEKQKIESLLSNVEDVTGYKNAISI